MQKVRLIALIVCFAAFFSLFGCRPAQETAHEKTPAAEPGVEPALEPASDPAAIIAEAEILEGRHEREKDYSSPFKTHYIDTLYAAVHLEDGADYSEDSLRTIARSVLTDVLAIRTRTGETTDKVTVYVVQRMLKERPVLLGDRLFCTAADLEGGAYREALCGACFGLAIPWKQTGLYEYVFGTVDESGLSAYYADEAHTLTASCAAVYLLPAVADEETVEAARKTAASLTAFIIENEGFEAFRAAVSTSDALPAWAAHLGIEAPVLPNGHEQAGTMTAESDRKYLCVLHAQDFTINVTEGAFAQTPDELYAFVCKLFYGMEFVMEQIREEIPSYAAYAEEKLSNGISIDLIVPTQEQVSRANTRGIHLAYEDAVWHEIVHVVMMPETNSDLWWVCEALAEHFSNRAASIAIPWDEVDASMFDEVDEETPAYRVAFFRTIWPVFLRERELDVSVPEGAYSDRAHKRALGIGELLLDDNPLVRGEDVSVIDVYGRTGGNAETDGNALSYAEATVLLEYLFDVYGTETVVTGYMNGRPLSETCGKDYPELYADCIAYLLETYGSLLAE